MASFVRVLVVLMAAFAVGDRTFAQSPDFFRQQSITLLRVIEKNHVSPKPLNDSFSARLFDNFLARLDSDSLLSTQHKESLFNFRYFLDDELRQNRPWEFLTLATGLFHQDLKARDSLYAKMASDKLSEERKGEIKSIRRYIKRTLNYPSGFDSYVAILYCDALARMFDPHTEYMPLQEKQQFESALSTEGYYFGFGVEEDEDGDLAVDRLMPGSPAWKSSELNKGDKLLNVSWQGKDTIDLEGADGYELSEILNESNDQTMLITVQKADGSTKTVSLRKEKMDHGANVIRSKILGTEQKVGYIYLPDFYYGERGAAGTCAGDVAREIIKLRSQNIAGLILDVRYNGGGSLLEALDMAGIFIDSGPFGMITDREGKRTTLKDGNQGTIYDGPMAVMINAQSASASELLAAILQDYHRAVVIGSATFGKGTAQVILPVDTAKIDNEKPELGFVKVTTGRFYRVDGTTTQYTGVMPDITLPDLFETIDYHEHTLPEALRPDTISANKYYKPLPLLPLAALSANSKTRMSLNKAFATKDELPEKDIHLEEAVAIITDLITINKKTQ